MLLELFYNLYYIISALKIESHNLVSVWFLGHSKIFCYDSSILHKFGINLTVYL